jgi:hypothetical protein
MEVAQARRERTVVAKIQLLGAAKRRSSRRIE